MKKITIYDYELGKLSTSGETDSERLARVVIKRKKKINNNKHTDFK